MTDIQKLRGKHVKEFNEIIQNDEEVLYLFKEVKSLEAYVNEQGLKFFHEAQDKLKDRITRLAIDNKYTIYMASYVDYHELANKSAMYNNLPRR